ncbi:MAG: PmoA family protein [bacterium]|nr:PmoA family protein [bacterium]
MQRCSLLSLSILLVLTSFSVAAEIELKKTDDGVTVNVDGELFTKYLIKSGAKPILYPVVGPSGDEITRSYPMNEQGKEGERKDHPHHRSFWFTHGDVNGVSFWHETPGHGNIVHREFSKVEGGDHPTIETVNDWLDADGKKLCEDTRSFTFGADDKARWIDVVVTVRASEGEVTFGDTKEGSFGVRVAGTMKVDSSPKGSIVTSEGETDKAAWGKAAAWVDYYGPVNGKTAGIAILNHPDSFRYPTYWHVRTYGLFAANPFGLHDFVKGKEEAAGAHAMKKGDSFTLKYRVLLHSGDTKQADVAGVFAEYAK